MESPDHNKIIKKTARAVLSPMGLIQKGQSRTWIDDNGWYFTVVEFQPSAYGKSSYLNIGIHFLWSKHDYLSYDIGGREDGFAEFDGDESKFYSDMLSFAEKCSVLVQQYRLFKKESHAKEYILKNKITYSITMLSRKKYTYIQCILMRILLYYKKFKYFYFTFLKLLCCVCM